ncbi:fumarylacetoacetate hydrolase family protein [Gracilimonas sp.]|uniref:fumarylacetoacetate hydrolase family protein n=1 Tax=Gracilimonas sp. TaxID=1974203 RepID=UPI0028718E1B|nr:fumarylacetoacetate hydrolase family protein [Gracilimonas sp.]
MQQPKIPGLDIPVRNIYCIGRNYAQHAKELGNSVPSEPIVFLKPLGAICYDQATVSIPPQSESVHFEAEIVVAISASGKNILQADAKNFIGGIGVGIDFTARDIQSRAKKKGHPWTLAKGFENFAPISDFITDFKSIALNDLDIKLFQNGFVKQHGNSSEMIFPIPQLITFLSERFRLHPGDLIFTGTPEGVGPVNQGDKLEILLNNGQKSLTVNIE